MKLLSWDRNIPTLVDVSEFLRNSILSSTCSILTLHSFFQLPQMDPGINTEANKHINNSLTTKVVMLTKPTVAIPTKRICRAIINNTECLNNNITEGNPCIRNSPINLSPRMAALPCPQPPHLGEQPPAQMDKFTTTIPSPMKPAGTNLLECRERSRCCHDD